VKAIDDLEARPDSEGRRQTLEEEVGEVQADDDPQIRQAAEELLARIKAQPGGERHIQQATGKYIAQADRHSTAQVNVDRRGPNRE
jgi:hypothetical protein